MKLTINDIALMAGVSKTTVSRVLNNSKPVSEDLRIRVIKIIEENSYKPNSVARSLVCKKTNVFGVVVPDISNPFISELVKSIQKTASKIDYNILLCNTDNKEKKEIEYLNILNDKQVDGIIFLTSQVRPSHIEFFKTWNKPVVTVSREIKELGITSVDIDNFEAVYNAVNYLVNLNHNKIAMIRASLSNKSIGLFRYEGYKKALIDSHIDINEDFVVESNFTVEDGYNAMSKLLSKKDIPTAVFCVSDEVAIGAIKCACSSGLKVPDDISIVGFDDIPISSMFMPSITTVRQPIKELGKKAVEVILDQISGVKTKNIVLSTEFIIRESTKRKK